VVLPVILGIDIGGTNTKLGVVNKEGKVLVKNVFETKADQDISIFLTQLKVEVDKISRDYSFDKVGIGSPNYSSKTGFLASPPNLSWGSINLKKLIEETLPHYEISIENDANIAAVGEKIYGEARALSDFIVITVGTGIGSGIFINNKLFTGLSGLAAEAGHIQIASNNRSCGCGGFDHFESYCSVSGMKKTYLEITGEKEVSYRNLVSRFNKDDEVAIKVFEMTAKHFANGLSTIAALFSPERFILTGGGMTNGDKFLKLIQDQYISTSYCLQSHIPIGISSIAKEDGAILGAAASASL
jgi:glucokinase